MRDDAVDAVALRPAMIEAVTASRDLLRASPAAAPRLVSGRDIKLSEDGASEALIVAALRRRSSWPILSEEAGWVDGRMPQGDEPYWALDPLDGSYNFHHAVPLCCTALAVCVGRRPLAGAVFDFNRDELFWGGRGLGLQCNGTELTRLVRPAAILATGFPARAEPAQGLARLSDQIGRWTKLRMIGSAALSLAWVAAGRFDGYEEAGISWWDVAAGLALVEGAGGAVAVEPPAPDAALDGPLAVRALGRP